MSRVLIIGGAGYIGSVLCREFLKNGHEVIVLDILRRGSKGIQDFLEHPKFTFYNADYMSKILPLTLKKHKDIDVVIHLAAIVGDKDCREHEDLATKTNVEGIKHLVDSLDGYNTKLFVASTCSVYGSNPNTCDEDSIVFPISHYAKTKIDMEYYLKEHAYNCLLFRFGTMYGYSPNMRYDLVVNRLVKDACTGEHTFKIFGGKQARPFLHPVDLANFFMSLFDKDVWALNGEVFNLVSENLTMEELGELVETVIPTSKMEVVPENQVERTYICRSYKAYKELGFTPRIRVREGLQEIERHLLGDVSEQLKHTSPVLLTE